MFGKVRETPQNEDTPFYPRSPYGCAKVFGHNITVNYRESYGLFACSGILFNHESIPGHTPVVVRQNGYIDVLPIRALIPHPDEEGGRVSYPGGGLEVWEGDRFVLCQARTGYWYEGEKVTIHGRGGIVESTPDHVVFTPESEKPATEFLAGDQLVLAAQPQPTWLTTMTEDEAWLLGILTAEGSVTATGHGRVVCGDDAVLAQTAVCWERVTAGTARKHKGSKSAFSDTWTPALTLRGARPYLLMLRRELYNRDGSKRVPKRILNASPELQRVFLDAYNQGDGLRAGNGIDPFKSFRTTSPTLAAGLVWLARTALGRRVSVYQQPGALGGGDSYLINLGGGMTVGNKGDHLRKPQDEVRAVERRAYRGWMYDLATDTGRFAAGVGLVVVHNSEKRGIEFVTRKISNAVARIKLGLQEELVLGDISPKRDWGYAGDYVKAMWAMLQQDEPRDYVVATGETHSVEEFLELAFGVADLRPWSRYVRQDERFYRPAEVDLLVGDATMARTVLGWRPEVDFPGLVERMVAHDLKVESQRLNLGRR
jgi:GDPmannose 4,6-dehydratase